MPVRDNVNGNQAQIAKDALEQVCSGARLDCLAQYYSPRFVDHVNDSEYRGHVGVQTSVNQYRKILSDITITVLDQVIEGQRVVSRIRGQRRCLRTPRAVQRNHDQPHGRRLGRRGLVRDGYARHAAPARSLATNPSDGGLTTALMAD